MNQERIIEHLYYKFKDNLVNKKILKAYLVNFIGLDYVKLIYVLLSGNNSSKLVNMSYIYEKLLISMFKEPKDMLESNDYKNYQAFTRLLDIN